MRIAEILSDLTSLRVCDQDAALALLSARPTVSGSAQASAYTSAHSPSHSLIVPDSVMRDVDLIRARDVLELHSGVKVANSSGLDRALRQAREDVEEALQHV
ncbi:hypothetical protein BDV97DRAFT_396479 [Delphinella strobiligena]|nr:hypothetical protein BDV97DRAFT_396479 [Delphinella strobiligena]